MKKPVTNSLRQTLKTYLVHAKENLIIGNILEARAYIEDALAELEK